MSEQEKEYRGCTARWDEIGGFARIHKKPMVFVWFQHERADTKFEDFSLKNHWFFKVFMLKCLQTQCVWYDFGWFWHGRARDDFMVFFARDYWNLLLLEHEMSFYIVFWQGKRGTTKQPDPVVIHFPRASSRKWRKWGCGLGGAGGARTRGPNNNYSLEVIMFNNNSSSSNNNNHLKKTRGVLPSARVFIRHQAIPPLRGGALQALPNIQTTLRDHPNPASRPMTLGHFTSWRADDRGYYTGVGYTPTDWSCARGGARM